MAFRPKVHNRDLPVANLPSELRSRHRSHAQHLNQLLGMGPRIDARWERGGSKQPKYAHLCANLKRRQMREERVAQVELENMLLLQKISKVFTRSHEPELGLTRDWVGGMRLTSNQVPVLDHYIAPTTKFGAALEPTSLSSSRRQQERERIEAENRALVGRLRTCRPTYAAAKFEADAQRRKAWLAEHGKPRPLAGTAPGTMPRPLSAARLRAQLPEMRRPFSAWYRTVDDAPLRVYGDMYGDEAVAGRARSSSP